MTRRAIRLAVAICCLVGAAAPAARAVAPAGSDVRVSVTGGDGDGAPRAHVPDVAYNPDRDEYLVVWAAEEGGETRIWARRVDPTGTPVAAQSQLSHDTLGYGNNPAVAYDRDDQQYLVVWEGPWPDGSFEQEIRGQRVSALGTEIGADFRISAMGADGDATNLAGQPDVAYGDGEFLVAYAGDDETVGTLADDEYEIWARRVAADGTLVDTDDVRISSQGPDGDPAYGGFNPAVAYNPVSDEYLIAFTGDDDGPDIVDDETEIFVRRFGGAGPLGVDATRITHAGPDGTAAYVTGLPKAAWNPVTRGYVVGYLGTDDEPGRHPSEVELHAARLDANGALVGATMRVTHVGPDGDQTKLPSRFDVAIDHGGAAVFAFSTAEGDAGLHPSEQEVYARELTADLTLGEDDEVRISHVADDGDPDYNPENAALAVRAGTRDALVVYTTDNNVGALAEGEFEVWATPITLNSPLPDDGHGTDHRGYRMIAGDGGTFAFGNRAFYGSLAGMPLAAPITTGVSTPDDGGQILVGADGGAFAFGDATFHGSLAGIALTAPIAAAAITPDGGGYWMFGADGAVYAFGSAGFFGRLDPSAGGAPIVAATASPTGNGYWLFGADGGVYAFGDAGFYGSMGGVALNGAVTAAAATPSGNGYWLFGADGGAFSFGDAVFHGSMGGTVLNGTVVAALSTATGDGYWLFGADGGVFSFGAAGFFGSLGGIPLRSAVVTAT